jgi:arginine decarboxylase
MFGPLPKRFFLVSGKGDASTDLNAFDAALLEAGVGNTNLIKLSSILPPGAKEIDSYTFPPGSFVPLAYGEVSSSEPGAHISAAIAVGIPESEEDPGLIMECAQIGDPHSCEHAVQNMVREGMESLRGLKIKALRSAVVTHKVQRVGAVFAAVVLCP